jgi:hypothetical protein
MALLTVTTARHAPNSKHYRLHDIPPFASTSRQINPRQALVCNFCKIRFRITLPSKPKSSNFSSPPDFPNQNPYPYLLSHKYATRSVHLVHIHFIVPICRAVKILKLRCVFFSTLPSLSFSSPIHLHQHPNAENPRPMFSSQCDRPSYTPT